MPIKKSPEFTAKLSGYAKRLGTTPEILNTIFAMESQGDSKAVNPISGATGLIQFMPKTAKAYGTTTKKLRMMSAERQLDYVYDYLKPHTGKINTIEDAYLSVFYPSAMGKADNHILQSKSQSAALVAQQNPGMDFDKDGVITVGDVKERIYRTAPQFRPDKGPYNPVAPAVADNTFVYPIQKATMPSILKTSVPEQKPALAISAIHGKEGLQGMDKASLMALYENPSLITDLDFVIDMFNK